MGREIGFIRISSPQICGCVFKVIPQDHLRANEFTQGDLNANLLPPSLWL